MDNIGYAIFKKSSILTIDSNGMFEDLQLLDYLNPLIPLIQVDQQLLCFRRITSRQNDQSIKDAYLVILLEKFNNKNQKFVLGSAICFKEYAVNEAKIIDGVQYLLSQLKRNFKSEDTIDNKDLEVLLPSTNKDFKIFKPEKLIRLSTDSNLVVYDNVSTTNNNAKSYLYYFQKHQALSNISSLFLSDKTVSGNLEGVPIEHISIMKLIQFQESRNGHSKTPPIDNLNVVLPEAEKKVRREYKWHKNLFKGLALFFFCLSIMLYALLYYQTGSRVTKSKDNSIYEIGDNLYISYNRYNVNVRSSPNTDFGDSNVKNTLSDGDKIYLLGFDKETLWAKIRYDENNEIGYVSNRLISKQIATNRVQPIYKEAVTNDSYSGAPIYASPVDITKDTPDVITYLQENYTILVKNKDLRLNSYSISFKNNNKTYHGYIEGKYFKYR